MRAVVALLAVSGMITIDQRDASRTDIEAPSVTVSADGRLVAFATYGRLTEDDTDDHSDVYVLDRTSGRLMLESGDEKQAPVQSDARFPVMSGDGRTLVYERNGQLSVRDRAGGTVGSLGTGRQPTISHDGSLIAFTSARTDAAQPDTNGAGEDIYLLDRSRGEVARLSVDSSGTQHASGESFSPSMSSDGRFVAFVSTAALDGAATGDRLQVFVRDTRSATTKRIAEGWDPAISGDGRFVAYVAYGAHRNANRRSPRLVYVADRVTGQSQLISGDADNRPANGSSSNPVISSDGRFVAFQSDASNLLRPGRAEDFNLLSDVFLFDRSAGVMLRVSTDEANCWIEASGGPAIDGSASVVAFSSKHPTGPGDGSDDYDLYVASLSR